MSLSNNLLDFFEQLPSVSLAQIAANIDCSHELIKLAFRSEKWRLAIGSQIVNRASLNLKIEEGHSEVNTELSTDFLDPKNRRTCFLICNTHENVKGVDVIRVGDKSYHQTLIDTLHFLNTKNSSISLLRLKIANAEWMGISDLLKINFAWITIGANRLKTRDLRMFLLHWFNGDSCQEVQTLTVKMSQEQVEEINMKEVVKDLGAVPWDPWTRDRKLVVHDDDFDYFLPSIDLADGYDIRLSNGTLATIHLDTDSRTLYFCTRTYRKFCMAFLDYMELAHLARDNEYLYNYKNTPDQEKYEMQRFKRLESLRNLRNDPGLDVTSTWYQYQDNFPA